LLRFYIGKSYGTRPSERIDEIRAAKKSESRYVAKTLELTDSDVVLDLGPGCGFIAKEIAPTVSSLHCLDISSSFLDFCKEELAECKNVSLHLMDYADMSSVVDARVNKIYALALFIHFNLYDFYHYLTSCHKVLIPKGRLLFDFLDDQYFDVEQDVWQRHSALYKQDRNSIFTNINFSNKQTVCKLLDQIGFRIVSEKYFPEPKLCYLLVEKL